MATSGAEWALVGVGGAAAVATAVAAGFTAWMATRTRDLAVKTKEMAVETAKMAIATQEDADASKAMVGEAQRDREMAYRPVLTLVPSPQDTIGAGSQICVKNIGAGAALNCLVIFEVKVETFTSWLVSTTPLDIAIGEKSDPIILRPAQNTVSDYFDQTDDFGAIFCRDVLDRRHRFNVRINREQMVVTYPPAQSFRVSEKDAPAWVTASVLWEFRGPPPPR
jgi:hypothetical protein